MVESLLTMYHGIQWTEFDIAKYWTKMTSHTLHVGLQLVLEINGSVTRMMHHALCNKCPCHFGWGNFEKMDWKTRTNGVASKKPGLDTMWFLVLGLLAEQGLPTCWRRFPKSECSSQEDWGDGQYFSGNVSSYNDELSQKHTSVCLSEWWLIWVKNKQLYHCCSKFSFIKIVCLNSRMSHNRKSFHRCVCAHAFADGLAAWTLCCRPHTRSDALHSHLSIRRLSSFCHYQILGCWCPALPQMEARSSSLRFYELKREEE